MKDYIKNKIQHQMSKLTLLFLLLFIGCADKRDGEQRKRLLSNFASITNNENNGVSEILKYYGGKCEYGIHTLISTESGSKKSFTLELSQSEVIEKQADYAQMSASNIAYLFYKNLKQERNNYDEIHSTLIFNDSKEITFKYPLKQLERVEKRMNLAYKIVSYLKNKQYDEIQSRLNNILLREKSGKTITTAFNIDELIANLKSIDPQLGNITEGFKPLGFRVYQIDYEKEILHIAGVIMRDKQNNNFSVDVELNSDKEEIDFLQYNL